MGNFEGNEDEAHELHEINVTPFIDVMLVLLIVFMVAAPLSTVDIGVNLPTAAAKPQPRPQKPIFLTIKSDLSLAIGNGTVTRDTLPQAIDEASGGDHGKTVFVRADRTVPYGELMGVMNLLRAAGYLKVALVALEGAPNLVASPSRAPDADTAPAATDRQP
jgi:biopolymer transport protein ExbD